MTLLIFSLCIYRIPNDKSPTYKWLNYSSDPRVHLRDWSTVDASVNFLRSSNRTSKQPFFLYIGLFSPNVDAPHSVCQMPLHIKPRLNPLYAPPHVIGACDGR